MALELVRERGLVSAARARARQRLVFAQRMLTIHLHYHKSKPESAVEKHVDHLSHHLRWSGPFASEVVRRSQGKRCMVRDSGALRPTDEGRAMAQAEIGRPRLGVRPVPEGRCAGPGWEGVG